MTEEIINADGSRNWQANILLDNVKRLEQKHDEIQERLFTLADTYQETRNVCKRLEQENKELKEENERLKKDFSSYEDYIEDWVSDNSILYQYDDRTPNTLEELQACMESTHEQWQKNKQALEEIRGLASPHCTQCSQIIKITEEALQ